MQNNPNQTVYWQNTDVQDLLSNSGIDGLFWGDYETSLQEQDYWWADSWIVMNTPWQQSGNNANTNTVAPEIPQFVGNLVEDDRVISGLVLHRTKSAQCFVLHPTRTETLDTRGLGLVS